MSQKQVDKNEVFDTHYDRMYEIRFKKKHTKSSIKFGAKLFIYLIIAGVSGAFFSNILLKFKYDKIIQDFQEHSIKDERYNMNYADIIDMVSPSLVTISDKNEKLLKSRHFSNNITGVVIDDKGNIITNYSVIKNFKDILVKLPSDNSEIFQGEIVIKNEHIDLAIINIKYLGELKPIKFADTYDTKEGEGIVVLSNSIGDSYIGNISPGVVTSTNERVVTKNKEFPLIQINAPIVKSNTGGAICNSDGELVGVASLAITQSNANQGFYYGISIEEIKNVITSTNALKNTLGIVEGGVLGDREEFKGFYVEELDRQGNAFKAGIKPTDIILTIDNYDVMTLEDIRVILREKKSGDIVKCKVLSNGEIKDVQIKIIN